MPKMTAVWKFKVAGKKQRQGHQYRNPRRLDPAPFRQSQIFPGSQSRNCGNGQRNHPLRPQEYEDENQRNQYDGGQDSFHAKVEDTPRGA